MMTTIDEKLEAFKKLLEIMDELRIKCPWDRKQTNETLRNLTIEETYELADAVTENKPVEIMKELGDLMLHIVFYAKIGSDNGDFDIGDVLNSLNKKLIYRHPHVYGEIKVNDHEDVKKNWEELKMMEGKTVLSGVPVNLPAMIKANRIQDKVKAVGFDWEEKSQIWEKVHEELSELGKEVADGVNEKIESEFGDLIFSIINAARLYEVDPESALEKTNKKFIKRFNWLEKKTKEMGKSLKEMTLDEMNKIWESAKDYD
jgi:XTP/dITP diphosphohydrolase